MGLARSSLRAGSTSHFSSDDTKVNRNVRRSKARRRRAKNGVFEPKILKIIIVCFSQKCGVFEAEKFTVCVEPPLGVGGGSPPTLAV